MVKYVDENGVSYSCKICPKQEGTSYRKFIRRINENGFSPKEAFDTLHLSLKEARKILGKPTGAFVKDIIPPNGLTIGGVYRRLYKGMSLKEALEKPRMKGGGVIKYKIDSVSVKYLLNDCEYARFKRWIIKGCGIKEAFKRCKTPFSKKLPEEMNKFKGKDYKRVYWRFRRKGWSLEEAINTPVLTNEESRKRACEKSKWTKRKGEHYGKNVRRTEHITTRQNDQQEHNLGDRSKSFFHG